ncbi:Cl-channel, voltage-gated family protein [Caballeronia fortuita]|uniref:Cl-channel, voltage-gated family protein n=1 Tax=Caballeronia fortuita TaxID=1777138 RepID=A0A158D558_9BURK|nr:chloride channel protein [Caballeronia fortuita]SAK89480.1 Cl-channel, voltage-gated family protein [Caballeronia fortuita]
MPSSNASAKLIVVTVLVGLGAGLGGMSLALLLHLIQHVAFGYGLDAFTSGESFLDGISAASPARRFIVLTLCGVVAGVGWWAVHRFGKPLVSIAKAVKSDDPRMPPGSTIAHALLQIVTVAMGSPLGREVAPREIGALWSGWLAHHAGLTPAQSRIMVACGAGAGLAAVYNVPLGGAVFVLEVLLCTFDAGIIAAAFATSSIGAMVAWIGLGDAHQYHLPAFVLNAQLLAWAIAMGPVFGAAARLFAKLTSAARENAPRDRTLPLLSIVNFAFIGVLVIYYPQLAGNGKGPAGLSFDDHVSLALAGVLLVLKVTIEVSSLRAGAQGGLLTPGLTNGALLGIVLGSAWNGVWPGTPLGAFAVIGAGAFLGAAMQMPLTALVLMLEFTRFDHDFLIPSALAIAGATLVYRWLAQRSSASSAAPSAAPQQTLQGLSD